MINLLHRFYDTTEGAITIDGQDLRNIRLKSLHRQIGLVPQETILFGGTIMENIRYGRERLQKTRSWMRAKLPMPMNSSSNCPMGTDHMREGYQPLRRTAPTSRHRSGHPQKSGRVLLLDEATSSLDSESERLVQEALERLMAGRTTFVVAHRLTTIQRADRILVLNKGRLVEEGTHSLPRWRKGDSITICSR